MDTQMKLGTKSFGRDAAEVASEAIANVSGSLVHADMSDVIAGRPEAEALDALRIMSIALSRLQLRHVHYSLMSLSYSAISKGLHGVTDWSRRSIAQQAYQ
jgi:large subunit ribosomal protein L31/Ran GTPase-activating protein 1